MIISFILMTLMFDLGMILVEEIRGLSLSGVKWLTVFIEVGQDFLRIYEKVISNILKNYF